MNRPRSSSFWRNPALAAVMVFLLLVGSVLAYTGLHARYHHDHGDGDATHHDDSTNCAICLFHSTSSTVDFPPAPAVRPELIELVSLAEPSAPAYAAVIITLWSGRAPPALSVS
jgi:hypothetical protein